MIRRSANGMASDFVVEVIALVKQLRARSRVGEAPTAVNVEKKL